jgi:hypothetical protein
MPTGPLYSRTVRLGSRSHLGNGLSSWLAPHLSINLVFPWNSSKSADPWSVAGRSRVPNIKGHAWSSYSTRPPTRPTSRRELSSSCTPTPSASGDVAGPKAISLLPIKSDAGERPIFPPRDQAVVKAIACEAVSQTKLPLSRLSSSDLATRAATALGRSISPCTVWRILDADSIKPWQYKYWIFPRDPQFAEKAGRILDLYAGTWEGEPLDRGDYIISSDEKTSIQARIRCHETLPSAPGRSMCVEHEYERGGALQYLAAWDVRRGQVLGRCEKQTGLDSFGRLVEQVMKSEPYRSAKRVFWVVDNGSSHRGEAAIQRLRAAYPKAIMVHTPVHASWLNQVEIYFSIIQRKVLTPNDFASLDEVEQRLQLYEELTNQEPRPFHWKFNRVALQAFLAKLEAKRKLLLDASIKSTQEHRV